MRFTAAEGADGHCEMTNRSLLNRRVLDWLDERCRFNGLGSGSLRRFEGDLERRRGWRNIEARIGLD